MDMQFSLHAPWRHKSADEVKLHLFLTSALGGSEWSAIYPGRFNPEERAPDAKWIGVWLGVQETRKKILSVAGFESRIVQPAVLLLHQL